MVVFRARRFALDRSLCHGDETRGMERRMAEDANDEKEGDAGVRGCVERGAEGTRGWREILVEGCEIGSCRSAL